MESDLYLPKVRHVNRAQFQTLSSARRHTLTSLQFRVEKRALSTVTPLQQHSIRFSKKFQQSRQRLTRPGTVKETDLTPTTDQLPTQQPSMSPIKSEETSKTANTNGSLVSNRAGQMNVETKERFDVQSNEVSKRFSAKQQERYDKKRRRRTGCFTCTRCCCYFLMISLMITVLLATLIATIIMIVIGNTTTTSTTTTTTTTTMTTNDPCFHLRWNQRGVIVAGNGTGGSALNQLQEPNFIHIDANDSLYICDHHNYRVQEWPKGAAFGTEIVSVGNGSFDHPEGITFDRDGHMYITGRTHQRVLRFSPDSRNGTTVAGQADVTGSTSGLLNDPLGLDVDENLNLYIAERENRRVMRWAPSATSGTVLIDAGYRLYGLLLSIFSSDQVYVSSEERDAVYLWTFGSLTPAVTLTAVNSPIATLKSPRGIKYDMYGNLYVADKGNQRVVMYCANRTVGRVVVGGSGDTIPALRRPVDIAFDSQMNLYVSDELGQAVIRFDRL